MEVREPARSGRRLLLLERLKLLLKSLQDDTAESNLTSTEPVLCSRFKCRFKCRTGSTCSCCAPVCPRPRIAQLVQWRDYQAYLRSCYRLRLIDNTGRQQPALGLNEWLRRDGAYTPLVVWLSRFRWKSSPSGVPRTKFLPVEVVTRVCGFLGRDSRLVMRMPDGLYLRRAYLLMRRRHCAVVNTG